MHFTVKRKCLSYRLLKINYLSQAPLSSLQQGAEGMSAVPCQVLYPLVTLWITAVISAALNQPVHTAKHSGAQNSCIVKFFQKLGHRVVTGMCFREQDGRSGNKIKINSAFLPKQIERDILVGEMGHCLKSTCRMKRKEVGGNTMRFN